MSNNVQNITETIAVALTWKNDLSSSSTEIKELPFEPSPLHQPLDVLYIEQTIDDKGHIISIYHFPANLSSLEDTLRMDWKIRNNSDKNYIRIIFDLPPVEWVNKI